MLVELLIGAGPSLHLSEHDTGNGPEMLKAECEMGLEGIVAKRTDAPYRSGYIEMWIKVKCTKTESFAVIGYEAVRGGVRSLQVAHLVDGALKPAGWVGSGLTQETSRSLWTALGRRTRRDRCRVSRLDAGRRASTCGFQGVASGITA